MGVINYIEFGGVKSSDYGIYVSGEGTFNAPERDVELIEIPGRNGDFSLDKGRFKNITVTYPAFNYETNLTDFRTRLSDFRNALKSKLGYQRLEDTFHPDEYRMATFVDMIDVNPVMYNTASTIELTFNCKPQRFLKSGEEEQTIGGWGELHTVTGEIASFEAEENTGIKSLKAYINPTQSGSGNPSPTNIRPISGWDSVNVTECGFNLWDEQWELGKFNTTTGENTSSTIQIRSKNYIPIKGGIQYYFKTSGAMWCIFFDSNKTAIPSNAPSGYVVSGNSVMLGTSYMTFTAPSNACYMRFYLLGEYGTTYKNDISINYPSTDHEYHAYNGQTITKSLGRTVYGGEVDLVSGELVIDRKILTIDGSTHSVSITGAYSYATVYPADYFEGVPTIASDGWLCNEGLVNSTNFGVNANYGYLYLKPDFYNQIGSTNEELNGFFSSNPMQIVIPMPNLVTYSLTPEQISTILGINNIWADSGNVRVVYGADPNIVLNPTPFESYPLLEVEGYGDINLNDDIISIENVPFGKLLLANKTARSENPSGSAKINLNTGNLSLMDNGDLIQVMSGSTLFVVVRPSINGTYSNFTATVTGGDISATATVTNADEGRFALTLGEFTYLKGTQSTHTAEVSVAFAITLNGSTINYSGVFTFDLIGFTSTPTGSNIDYSVVHRTPSLPTGFFIAYNNDSYIESVYGYSTKTSTGTEYIDLDLGEAYILESGKPVSINNIVSLPARLPELKTGANTITHDNTITSLKVTPRWWKI